MMRFTIIMIFSLSIVIGVIIWFSGNTGQVSVAWRGWLIEMSIGRFILALTVLGTVLFIAFTFLKGVGRLPTRIRDLHRISRRERGYRALTYGMVAVAAGDSEEANRQAKRADVLLNDPPLTMLLSAQAAQLNNDEDAANRYFSAMLERPETAFLGVRGLLMQAEKRKDRAEELKYAQIAAELQPKTPWVLQTIFKLQVEECRWIEALNTLEQAVKLRVFSSEEALYRRATLLLGCSIDAENQNDLAGALRFARKASSLAPDFLPAMLKNADLLYRSGKKSQAARAIQTAWEQNPHPSLAQLYGKVEENINPIEQVQRFERLSKINPGHPESLLALAEAALAAKLWSQARTLLESVAQVQTSSRVCRMTAVLEEKSGGEPEIVRTWLMRAATAEPDNAWICEECAIVNESWAPVCGACGALSSLAWKQPTTLPSAGIGLETALEEDKNILESRRLDKSNMN